MKPSEILANHKLKRTSCREGIISVIMDSDFAMSEEEINEKLSAHYDRTTIYRSFKTLENNHIIHKIVVDSKLVKYALDYEPKYSVEHAHFYCKKCEAVKCLDCMPLQKSLLPQGYSIEHSELIIKGLCNRCSNSTL